MSGWSPTLPCPYCGAKVEDVPGGPPLARKWVHALNCPLGPKKVVIDAPMGKKRHGPTEWIAGALDPPWEPVKAPEIYTDAVVEDIQRRIDSGEYVPADIDEGEEFE